MGRGRMRSPESQRPSPFFFATGFLLGDGKETDLREGRRRGRVIPGRRLRRRVPAPRAGAALGLAAQAEAVHGAAEGADLGLEEVPRAGEAGVLGLEVLDGLLVLGRLVAQEVALAEEPRVLLLELLHLPAEVVHAAVGARVRGGRRPGAHEPLDEGAGDARRARLGVAPEGAGE